MRRLKTVRRPPIYPKTPGHLPCSSLTHPLPLSSRRPSVSFGGFGLKSDDGWAAPQAAEALDVALSTVYRVKQRFAEEGLERVLQDRPQANRPRKLDDRGEAHLIALACSPPPEGHDHWTLRLLAGKVVELGLTPSMSHEGVRQRLKKTPSSRGRRRSGAFPR